jgi:hypothetical protein
VTGLISIGIGGALALLAWLIPRHVARAQAVVPAAVLLDLTPVLLGGALLLSLTGRPVFSGLVLFALGAGFALADRTKRQALREPVVFSEMSELRHVFTHPHLYLPFAGVGIVIGGCAAAIGLGGALLIVKPAVGEPQPLLFIGVAASLAGAGWLLSREPCLGVAAALLRRLQPSGDPFHDARRLGPFASLLVYGVIARAERRGRRAPFAPARPTPPPKRSGAAVPLVLVQCESFFDARRLSPLVPRDLLPAFDACRRSAAQYGGLEVAAWGANTMRAEFAVLTGIAECDLGYDRFNPYHAFARAPLASLARRLREEGYRAICLHPFDREFFRRDLTLPALGFEEFFGLEALGGSRRPPYCSDPELAGHILRVLEAEGPRVFIFAITMGNHGPWLTGALPQDRERFFAGDLSGVPQGDALLRYLDGLRRSDEMLQTLMDGMAQHYPRGLLGFYGDHLPSLPAAFDHFGFAEWSSDYVLWPGIGSASRRDLPACQLPRLVLDALAARGVDPPSRAVSVAAE